MAGAPTAIAMDGTTTATVGWITDPTRPTRFLLSSRAFSLLCVWSAMHLNIPPHHESVARTWMKDLQWGLMGCFGPELVVFAAWRQYNSANALQVEVQKHLDIQPSVLPRRGEGEAMHKVNSLTKLGWLFLYNMLNII